MFSFLFGTNFCVNITADKIATIDKKVKGVGDIKTAIERITIRVIIFILAFFCYTIKDKT